MKIWIVLIFQIEVAMGICYSKTIVEPFHSEIDIAEQDRLAEKARLTEEAHLCAEQDRLAEENYVNAARWAFQMAERKRVMQEEAAERCIGLCMGLASVIVIRQEIQFECLKDDDLRAALSYARVMLRRAMGVLSAYRVDNPFIPMRTSFFDLTAWQQYDYLEAMICKREEEMYLMRDVDSARKRLVDAFTRWNEWQKHSGIGQARLARIAQSRAPFLAKQARLQEEARLKEACMQDPAEWARCVDSFIGDIENIRQSRELRKIEDDDPAVPLYAIFEPDF